MAFFCASPTVIPTSLSVRLRSSSLNSVNVSRFRFSRQKSLLLVLPSLALETSVKSVRAKGGMENESEPWGVWVHKSLEQITKSVCFEAEEFWMYDIRVSIAQESITVEDRDLIKEGLSKIKQMITSDEFVLRKDREDVHINIEASLTYMLGEPAKKLLIAKSRDEHVVTVLRLFCHDAIDRVLNLFKKLQEKIMSLAERNYEFIVPDNTNLERDQPIFFDNLLQSYVERLEQDAERLIHCKKSINDADSDRNFVFKLREAIIKTAETLSRLGKELAMGVTDPNTKHIYKMQVV